MEIAGGIADDIPRDACKTLQVPEVYLIMRSAQSHWKFQHTLLRLTGLFKQQVSHS